MTKVLQDAHQNLAISQKNDRFNDAVNGTVFRVITHDEIPQFVVMREMAEVEPHNPPATCLLLIRMEVNAASISEMSSYYPAIESAILLQNLGWAYMGLAHQEEEYTAKALEKRQCAHGLFKLSFHILETLCQEPYLQNNDDLLFILLPLLILILQSLKYTTAVLGLLSEYVDYDSHLLTLRPKLNSVIYHASSWESAPARAA